MNDSLYDRLRRGEDAFASSIDAAISPHAIVAKAKRRRTTRAVATGTAGLAAVSAGAIGAFAWLPSALEPATTDGATVADPTPSSATPSPTPEPAGTDHVYGQEPTGIPVLTPASQAVADATISPRQGPSFVVGQPGDPSAVLRAEVAAGCADAWCGMPALPPVTEEVIDSGDLTAAVSEWGIVQPEPGEGGALRHVALLGPDAGAYLAFDFGAWAVEEGLTADGRSVELSDIAFDPGNRLIGGIVDTYIPGDDYQTTNRSMFVLWDLNTGTSTVVAEGLDRASVSWDGKDWRLFGYGPEGTLGVLVSTHAESWTAAGMEVAEGWLLVEGTEYNTLIGRHLWTKRFLVGGVAFPTEPEDASFCEPPVEASATEGYLLAWCSPADLVGDAAYEASNEVLYSLTAGEGWVRAGTPTIELVPPASTAAGKLQDGWIMKRDGKPVYVEGASETAIETPEVDFLATDAARTGLWTLGSNEIGWIDGNLEYRSVLSYDGDMLVPSLFPFD